ncbi:glycoside hydrolase [Rhizoclosmatium globosum]|uniref:Glycoside hydrolase n=1 Tax=Rhizoclosmatium globosum TaxID=329046 RepID=A0A1Y2BK89_9FUNG|nr:glycoside hydrolase [Rhizoclosmatium globosum]|eukprot:ORY34525.1 glycoside hydrolase [Rhizoclosmatium globosum]
MTVDPAALLSSADCSMSGLSSTGCYNGIQYHCLYNITHSLAWSPWYPKNCTSPLQINLKSAYEGSPCSIEGSTECVNDITYQCVYFTTEALTWNQYFTGACNGTTLPIPPQILPAGVAPCFPLYQPGTTYTGGTIVSLNSTNYQSKYYTTSSPTQSTDWTSLGPCDATSLTPRYWANWAGYSRPQNNLDKLDLSGFSAINYAFLKPLPDGSVTSFDAYADGIHIPVLNGAVRMKYPNLRTMVSVGGWSGSKDFSTIAGNAAARDTFVKAVRGYIDSNGFDGVDIDWEYPRGKGLECNTVSGEDPVNYLKLLQALRGELGSKRAISLAVSVDVSRYVVNGTNYLPLYAKYVSYFQVMAYDFYGSWSPYTDWNSNLNAPSKKDPSQPKANGPVYSISSAIKTYMALKIPKKQIVVGLSFYGRSWQVSPNPPLNGLYQPCAGVKQSSGECAPIIGDVLDVMTYPDACGNQAHSTVWMYMNLRGDSRSGNAGFTQLNAPLAGGPSTASNGWTRRYFKYAEGATLYHPSYRGAPTVIMYDDPTSIKAKAGWAKKQGLGGVMAWEIDQDYMGEMIGALRNGWAGK